METNSPDYQRIARAIAFLAEHHAEQPDLAACARAVHLSPYHFQRLFRRWAGISPKRFVQLFALERAKEVLARPRTSVLDAALGAGLSGPSRLHDLFVSLEAVSPGDFARRGAALAIDHGVHPSPFGPCFLAATARGVCHLAFVDGRRGAERALAELRERYPAASYTHDPERTRALVTRVFRARGGEALPLHVEGTAFQVRVWRALLSIPPGELCTYGELARALGTRSPRAVGNAVGQNPVAFAIPCHRVIRASGVLGGYRWGPERKRAVIAWEAAQVNPA